MGDVVGQVVGVREDPCQIGGRLDAVRRQTARRVARGHQPEGTENPRVGGSIPSLAIYNMGNNLSRLDLGLTGASAD